MFVASQKWLRALTSSGSVSFARGLLAVGLLSVIVSSATSLAAEEQKQEPPATVPPATAPAEAEKSAVEFFPELNANEKRILAALEEPTKMDFVEMPLSEVTFYLSDHHSIPIKLDAGSLSEAGVEPGTPLTFNVNNIPLKAALRLALEDLDLAAIVKDDVLLITTKESADSHLITRIYPIADFLAADDDGKQLFDVITSTVRPQSWVDDGGPGSIALVSSAKSIVVSQDADAHDELLTLLRALRDARKQAQ